MPVPTALPRPRCQCLTSLSEPTRKLAFEACSCQLWRPLPKQENTMACRSQRRFRGPGASASRHFLNRLETSSKLAQRAKRHFLNRLEKLRTDLLLLRLLRFLVLLVASWLLVSCFLLLVSCFLLLASCPCCRSFILASAFLLLTSCFVLQRRRIGTAAGSPWFQTLLLELPRN